MVKERMLAAQQLIKEKRYAEARTILKTVNHPKAKEWLARLDQIAPETKKKRRRTSPLALILLVVLIIVIAAAGVLLVPRLLKTQTAASASPAGTLARYAPADTALYATIRTDSAYIETLDGLVSRVIAKLPPGTVPPGVSVSLKTLLDQTAQEQFGGDFNTTVRSWLGDQAIISVPPLVNGSAASGLVAVSIKDRAKAVEFVEKFAGQNDLPLTKTDEGGYTLFTSEAMKGTVIAVGNDALFLTTDRALLPQSGNTANLTSSAAFNSTIDLLPADKYDIMLYVDAPALLREALKMMPTTQVMDPGLTNASLSALGPVAIGGTMLDSRALVLDMVQKPGDLSGLKNAGLSFPSFGPVDPAFLANVPANATLVLHGTNLKAVYDAVLENLRATASQTDTSAADIDATLAQVEDTVKQLTGLSLQNDVIAPLTGDFAVFMSYEVPAPGAPSLLTMPFFPDQPVPLNADFGIVLKAADPAKAAAIVEGAATALGQMGESQGLTFTREQIGGANAVVIPFPEPQLSTPLEVVIGANERVLVIGTRKGAAAALSGSGGLNTAPRFTQSQPYLLKNPTSMWYADSNTITLVGDALVGFGLSISNVFMDIVSETMSEEELQQRRADILEQQRAAMPQLQQNFRDLAALFTGATISTATDANGSAYLRAVLLLAQ